MTTLKSFTQPFGALFLSLLVAAACWGVWQHANLPLTVVDAPPRISGFAYSGFRPGQDPNAGLYPTEAELAEDFALIARHSGRIRTYTATENTAVPRLAAMEGLRVTAGAWLDKRLERNDREIAAIVKSVREHPNIDRVMIGNEAFLRGDLTAGELIVYLKQVKKRVRVPVSTAEPWHVWMRNPELVKNVDFITVHLLPYWEGLPVAEAVDYAFDRLDELREAYPRKKIVIGEVGWPS
ncbi:MAG: beta-(1-3)-glucosyl transferase, partial [Burkholderiales bacterium]